MPERQTKKVHRLYDITLDEISLVDEPANPQAKVVIVKRSDDTAKAATGIKFVLGFKEGGGSEVQSVLFDGESWTKDKAAAWLKDHDMHADKVDETATSLRYRQKDPASYTRFRTITPGETMSKAIRNGTSLTDIMDVLGSALHERYPADHEKGLWCYIKEVFSNYVIFEYGSQCYSLGYTLGANADGTLAVNLDFSAVPVEAVWQEVKAMARLEPQPKPIPAPVPADLAARVLRLGAALAASVERFPARA